MLIPRLLSEPHAIISAWRFDRLDAENLLYHHLLLKYYAEYIRNSRAYLCHGVYTDIASGVQSREPSLLVFTPTFGTITELAALFEQESLIRSDKGLYFLDPAKPALGIAALDPVFDPALDHTQIMSTGECFTLTFKE